MPFPRKVTLIEVGPRDGLQNEHQIIPTALKIKFIDALSKSGLSVIEATSFVSSQWVPQMADHTEVMAGIQRHPHTRYMALVPNKQGLMNALKAATPAIAVFTSPSEKFTKKNTNCSIEESLNRISEVIVIAKKHNIPVRGYISCALGCPYEGDIPVPRVVSLVQKLLDMGCYQISLGDTIGIATPHQVQRLIDSCTQTISVDALAVHFHDTYAQALTNIYVSLEKGISTIDSAVAGLGGCPYATGASGNVATEDVVYLLNGLNITCGVDLMRLTQAGHLICDYLGQAPRSKVAVALRNKTTNRK